MGHYLLLKQRPREVLTAHSVHKRGWQPCALLAALRGRHAILLLLLQNGTSREHVYTVSIHSRAICQEKYTVCVTARMTW